MTGNFSWVVDDRLCGSALPGRVDRDGLAGDLRDLASHGISALVTLLEVPRWFGSECADAGLAWLYYPIRNFGIPEDQPGFDGLTREILDRMDRQPAVCVHCYAGIGRTGIVLSCVVGRYLGLPPDEAIAHVRRTRPALETMEQERFVKAYLSRHGL